MCQKKKAFVAVLVNHPVDCPCALLPPGYLLENIQTDIYIYFFFTKVIMAVEIPGLVSVIIFYICILAIGVWGSHKSKKVEKTCPGSKSDVSIVGGRNINVLVGIFTMTGKLFVTNMYFVYLLFSN